jgi:hypothetical protein
MMMLVMTPSLVEAGLGTLPVLKNVVPLSSGQIFVISEHMLIGANFCVLVLGHISDQFPFKNYL